MENFLLRGNKRKISVCFIKFDIEENFQYEALK